MPAARRASCRLARLSDLEALLALEKIFPGDRLSRRQMRFHIKNPKAKFWVCADAHDEPVAALLGFFHRGRPARIYSVVTAAVSRGKGLGETLVRAFLEEAKRRRCDKVILEVRTDSAAAIRLYEKLGFTRLRSLPGYYDDGADGLKMILKLSMQKP